MIATAALAAGGAVGAGVAVWGAPVRRLPARSAVAERAPAGRIGVLLASAVLVLAWAAGPIAAAVIGAVAVGVARVHAGRRRARSAAAARTAVAALCTTLAGELRAGRPSLGAFAVAVECLRIPLGDGFSAVRAMASRGDVVGALRVAGRAPPLADLERLAACWAVAADAGSGLADAVDRIAVGLRADDESRREAQVALAGPRATVRVLAGLPVLGVLLGTAMGADPLAFLFGSPAGWACLLGGGLLDAAGVAVLRCLVRAAMPEGRAP